MLYLEEYLEYIKSQIGSTEYQHYLIGGVDHLNGGTRSCAYFVSKVLSHFAMIQKEHTSVIHTIEDMLSFEWKEIPIGDVVPGDVLVWELNRLCHNHIGFYFGGDQAISNDRYKKVPTQHHWKYEGKRQIIKIFRYKKEES